MPVIKSKKRNSVLGSLALLVGFSAVGLSAIDIPGLPSVNIGPWTVAFAVALDLGVGTLALVSLVLAAKSRRTGTEIPGAALAVALAAGGIFYFRHRTPPAAPAPQATSATAPTMATQAPVIPPKPEIKSPASPTLPPSITQATSAVKTMTQQSAAALARQQRAAALRDAKADFATAQSQVIQSLQSDAAYQKAKAATDDADAQLRDARLQYPPGDSNLVTTSQTALAARDALNQLVADAVAKNPTAAAAKAKLDALTQQNEH